MVDQMLLPMGWGQKFTARGVKYFVNHITKINTFQGEGTVYLLQAVGLNIKNEAGRGEVGGRGGTYNIIGAQIEHESSVVPKLAKPYVDPEI